MWVLRWRSEHSQTGLHASFFIVCCDGIILKSNRDGVMKLTDQQIKDRIRVHGTIQHDPKAPQGHISDIWPHSKRYWIRFAFYIHCYTNSKWGLICKTEDYTSTWMVVSDFKGYSHRQQFNMNTGHTACMITWLAMGIHPLSCWFSHHACTFDTWVTMINNSVFGQFCLCWNAKSCRVCFNLFLTGGASEEAVSSFLGECAAKIIYLDAIISPTLGGFLCSVGFMCVYYFSMLVCVVLV